MTPDFYYSFNLDFDLISISIGVDDTLLKMSFRDSNKIEPQIKQTEYGYSVVLKNIYQSIDILYELRPDSIKEQIIIKDRKAVSQIFVDFSLENGNVLDAPKGKKFIFIDEDKNEIFTIPYPYVVSNRRNVLFALKDYVDIKISRKPFSFEYNFNHLLPKQFPVKVDPTFSFSTMTTKGLNNSSELFNQFNTMMITGSSYGDEYAQNELVLSSQNATSVSDTYVNLNKGLVMSMSDDVVFERNIRLIFPWVDHGSINVYATMGDNTKILSGKMTNGDESTGYSEIDIEVGTEGGYMMGILPSGPGLPRDLYAMVVPGDSSTLRTTVETAPASQRRIKITKNFPGGESEETEYRYYALWDGDVGDVRQPLMAIVFEPIDHPGNGNLPHIDGRDIDFVIETYTVTDLTEDPFTTKMSETLHTSQVSLTDSGVTNIADFFKVVDKNDDVNNQYFTYAYHLPSMAIPNWRDLDFNVNTRIDIEYKIVGDDTLYTVNDLFFN